MKNSKDSKCKVIYKRISWFFWLRIIVGMIILIMYVLHAVIISSTDSHALTSVGEDEVLTLEDYLANGSNCFTEQLSALQKEIDVVEAQITEFDNVMKNFVVDDNWQYTYVGDDYKLTADTPHFDDYKDTYYNQTGSYVSSINLYNGKVLDTVGMSGLQGVRNKMNSIMSQAQSEYDELALIYGGFAVVGYDDGKGFSVNVTKNDFFDNSWSGINEELYGSATVNAAGTVTEGKPSKVETYIAEPLGNGAWSLYKWMYKWNIDLTIDGLVYGRMASSYKGTADFTHFGLETNNPYGIVGASAYYVLRRILLSALPVILIIMLFLQLFKNTPKGRAQLKEAMNRFVLIMVLLFAAPYALNLCIYIRDAVLKGTSMGMSLIFDSLGLGNEGVGNTIIGSLYAVYYNSRTLLNAILLLAAVGSGFFYFTQYITMAVLLAGCFGILPIILFISIWNQKIINDWWNIFFPVLCAPLIDVILLQIPTVVLMVYRLVVGSTGSFVLGILLMVIIWKTMQVRERIVRLLGFDGVGGQRGLGLLAGMMMLARQARLGRRFRNRDNGMLADKEMDNGKAAAFEHERGTIMNEARVGAISLPEGDGIAYRPNENNQTDAFLSTMDESQLAGGQNDIPGLDNLSIPAGNEVPIAGNIDSSNDSYSVMEEPSEMPYADTAVMGTNISYGEETGREFERAAQPSIPEELRGVAMSSINSDFRDSLDKTDKARYDNLVQMDAYNNQISQNEAVMNKAGYTDNKGYTIERSRYMGQMDDLNQQINVTQQRMDNITDKTSVDYAAESKNMSSMLTKRAEITGHVARLDHAAELDKANTIYRRQVNACMQKETAFARAEETGGMRSNSYSTANEFMYQRRIDNARKSMADFRNFDTRRYEGILTPREKENFYREREVHQQRERIMRLAADVAGNTIGVAGAAAMAVPAAAFSAYGGAGTTAMAAGAAAGAGIMAGRAASRGMNSININGTGHGVSNSGMNNHRNSNRQPVQPSEKMVLNRLKNNVASELNSLEKSNAEKYKKEQEILRELTRRADNAQ